MSDWISQLLVFDVGFLPRTCVSYLVNGWPGMHQNFRHVRMIFWDDLGINHHFTHYHNIPSVTSQCEVIMMYPIYWMCWLLVHWEPSAAYSWIDITLLYVLINMSNLLLILVDRRKNKESRVEVIGTCRRMIAQGARILKPLQTRSNNDIPSCQGWKVKRSDHCPTGYVDTFWLRSTHQEKGTWRTTQY